VAPPNFILILKNLSSWCGCGKTLTTSTDFAMVDDSKCDLRCAGNTKQWCGAFHYFNVFKSCEYSNKNRKDQN
jgi:hypothetical protein